MILCQLLEHENNIHIYGKISMSDIVLEMFMCIHSFVLTIAQGKMVMMSIFKINTLNNGKLTNINDCFIPGNVEGWLVAELVLISFNEPIHPGSTPCSWAVAPTESLSAITLPTQASCHHHPHKEGNGAGSLVTCSVPGPARNALLPVPRFLRSPLRGALTPTTRTQTFTCFRLWGHFYPWKAFTIINDWTERRHLLTPIHTALTTEISPNNSYSFSTGEFTRTGRKMPSFPRVVSPSAGTCSVSAVSYIWHGLGSLSSENAAPENTTISTCGLTCQIKIGLSPSHNPKLQAPFFANDIMQLKRIKWVELTIH